jgi:phosphoribosylaminoimidazole carboxylase PurE protein
MTGQQPRVAILIGSDSDWSVMSAAAERLAFFGIEREVRVMSAHRTPQLVAEYVSAAPAHGIEVFIVGAGAAAHLAGVVAAHTTRPVIGVPLAATGLNGMDALLATVQMPAGVPVATVAIGKAGAENAAILAAQILALDDESLARKLAKFKEDMARKVAEKNEALRRQIGN